MKYKREEYFRFSFNTPIPGFFTITKMNGLSGKSKKGPLLILDLSPKGIKFQSRLDLPDTEDLNLSLSFTLNTKEIILPGKIVWKKKISNDFHYGFTVTEELEIEDITKEIISELKAFRKKQLEDAEE